MEVRLQQKMEIISGLEMRLNATQDGALREKLLAQKRQAIREGAALLKEAQANQLAVNRECLAREKNLPSDVKTCLEEDVDDTQVRMMTMLIGQLAE